MQQKVYKKRMTDLDDLKHRIKTEWAQLDHAVIAASVHQWRRRLSGCVKASGGHFQRCFWFWYCVCSDNWATFLAVVDQSNSCTLFGPFGLIALSVMSFSVVVRQWLGDRDCTAQYNCCLPATTDCRRFCCFVFLFFSFFLFNFIRCPCNVFDVIVSP